MKHEFFESKEQYLSMRKAWAEYFNTHARKLERNQYGNKMRKLTSEHFIIYAILRGKGYENYQSHISPNTCLWFPTYPDSIKRFLEPFGDTITQAQYEKARDIFKGA